jgi:Cys-tRNA(Pro)/Cys-tRNA(Cys) deacylase
MTRKKKTNAMRFLEAVDIPYQVIEYPKHVHDALGVADYAEIPPRNVYKTLVVEADDPGFKPMLIMIGGDRELDLKQAARSLGAKKVHMVRQVDAERLTGLQVGGISPLAVLNRGFDIYIDSRAEQLDFIVISAGKRGLNLRLDVSHLVQVTDAEFIKASTD